MCGIAGFLYFNKGIKRFDVKEAVKRLSHRGPDDEGFYDDARVSLGHKRLSIIDLETGHQPIKSEDGSVVLVFNGEIYNHGELRKELAALGHGFRTRSDSEVIIHAYEEYGIDKTLSLLNGMFAFAVWDKVRGHLILARDRMGIKPIYFAIKKDYAVFASEIKSMFTGNAVSRRLRKDSLFEYFTAHGSFAKDTMFAEVSELEPSHYILIESKGGSRTVRYWDITSVLEDGPRQRDESGVANEMDERLGRAVDHRLMSDVPLGVLLSGGIDSSLISFYVATSGHYNAKSAKFFNARNLNREIDESEYAGLQVDFLKEKFGRNVDLESSVLESENFLGSFPYLSYIYDEPVQFQSSGYIYDMCSRAAGDRIKVLLVGEGSDELFFGYDRFWRTLTDLRSGKHRGFSDSEIIYFGGGIGNAGLVERLTGVGRERLRETEPFRWLERHRRMDLEDRITLYSIVFRLQSVLMRMDRMSMAAGVEVRVPFLDHTFVRFALNIDNGLKGRGGIPKYLVKRLAEGKVHGDIIKRKKMGSPSDIAFWLDSADSEAVMRNLTDSPGSISRTELDYPTVKRIVDSHYQGKNNYAVLIWMLFSIEMWHRMLSEKEPIFAGGDLSCAKTAR